MTDIRKLTLYHTDTGTWNAWFIEVWRDGPAQRVRLDDKDAEKIMKVIAPLL